MEIEKTENGIIENWTAQEVAEAYQDGSIMLVDVRTPAEYSFEHVAGAMLSPMAFFNPSNLPGAQGKPVVFHCGSGVRSKKVAESCLAADQPIVRHLAGGFVAWKQAGLPYIGTNMATGAPEKTQKQD
jgi:rhodanese-related sulfurtransferase